MTETSGAVPHRPARQGLFGGQVSSRRRPVEPSEARRKTPLKPRTILDSLAQNDARRRVQALSKRTPCGNTAAADKSETCL